MTIGGGFQIATSHFYLSQQRAAGTKLPIDDTP
jgi:hypothetical protein